METKPPGNASGNVDPDAARRATEAVDGVMDQLGIPEGCRRCAFVALCATGVQLSRGSPDMIDAAMVVWGIEEMDDLTSGCPGADTDYPIGKMPDGSPTYDCNSPSLQ